MNGSAPNGPAHCCFIHVSNYDVKHATVKADHREYR